MNIKRIQNGPFSTNAYLVEDGENCVIIDPGLDRKLVADKIRESGKSLLGIVGTHSHPDHIGIVSYLKKQFNSPFYLHICEESLLRSFREMAGFVGIFEVDTPEVDVFIEQDGKLEIGNFCFEVIHTPGHTPGSISLLLNDVLFTGDTLFRGSVGRVDLPGGDQSELIESLEKLRTLNDNLRILPGHGPDSTLGYEKKFNPFLNISV